MAINFQAFIDESYSTEEFVLAGHIAPAAVWAEFAKEWEDLLPFATRAENGKFHFKMSEMAATPERMERVPAFYRLIEERVISSISCRINLADFARAQERLHAKANVMRWTINLNLWENTYFFAFRMLLDNFHNWREKFQSHIPLDEKVDFIFDEKTEKHPILEAWEEYVGTRDDEVRAYYGATPRFENDQDFLPLQAADLWAWWVREWYEEDANSIPDKLRTYDFGKWRGRERPNIVISANEDQLLDLLQSVAISELARDIP
jgi:hypothetical protein